MADGQVRNDNVVASPVGRERRERLVDALGQGPERGRVRWAVPSTCSPNQPVWSS